MNKDRDFEDDCIMRGHREAGAIFSPCEKYRYLLWRVWNTRLSVYPINRAIHRLPIVAFVGLNPSTATESINDNTVTRCIDYAKQWGFEGMYMLNIHAFRSTDPKIMMSEPDPTGTLNNVFLVKYTLVASMTLACWGNGGIHLDRGQEVEALIPDLHMLGLTLRNQPKHPLFLSKSLKPNAHRRT